MRSLFLFILLGIGLPAMAAEDFHALYEVKPQTGSVYELGWVKDGLAKRQEGKLVSILNLDCQTDRDQEMKVNEEAYSFKAAQYRCNYMASMEEPTIFMGLERDCKLLFNSAFFEVACHEEYSGGAHPDSGNSYYYLDGDGNLVPEESFAQMLAKAGPLQADFKKQSKAMQKSCSDWFVQEGDVFSQEELENILGTANAQRAGITKEGAPLIGMSYELVRVARANPCDQKTFWVKIKNKEAWKELVIKGEVRRLKSD